MKTIGNNDKILKESSIKNLNNTLTSSISTVSTKTKFYAVTRKRKESLRIKN